MKFGLIGLVLTTAFAAGSAAAQIMSNPGQWYINNQIYSTRVFNGVVANSMLRKSGAKRPPAPPAKSGKTTDYGVFKPGPANLLPSRLAAKSSGNAGETERVFDAFIDLYRQTARKDGFPADDLAYAFEYFVVNNYQIYHDLVELPDAKDPRARRARDGFERIRLLNEKKLLQVTPAQERAIYGQFREMFAGSAELAKMTDAQKQEGAEMMAILFGVNFAVYMKGLDDGDDALAGKARQMAKTGLEKLLGAPVDKIRITNEGLEIQP